jgi:hypothetical protein
MGASKNRRARLFHIRDEIEAVAIAVEGLSYEQYEASYIHRRAIERAAQIISEAARRCRGTIWHNAAKPRGAPSSGLETFCDMNTSGLTTGCFGESQPSICLLWSLSCSG